MNPTIEQTVKAIETGIEKLCKLGNGEHDGNSDGNVIAQSLRQHLTSLRALTEPSKTDEELARELYSTLETLPNNDTTYPYEEYKQSAIHSITQAFTAIRAQVLDDVTTRLKTHQFSPAPYTDMMETLRKLKANK